MCVSDIHVFIMSDIHTHMDSKETKQHNPAPAEKSEVALREEEMLAFWNANDIFNKTVEKDAPNGEFVFYDGPPFATGLPHYGHILAGTIKDAIPRFWTMRGYKVRRKWGWDCHGLPLENLIEKKLGLATKRDIEAYGVQNFNEAARGAVLEYADDWRRIIPRMGRFVDMDDDYKTMDASYTESVWWVFSELNRKGLVYEGFKSMHLCPRCGTTLSNFEVNQGYKDVKDIAVTVKLPLLNDDGTIMGASLLVWTTTPWTLPGNMAAAVHNEHDYVKVQLDSEAGAETVILAETRLAQLGTDEYEVLEKLKGADLVGKAYVPPFPYLAEQEFVGKENAWKVYHADFVELGEEGTGAVHIAPAYGEDDMVLAQQNNIPIMHHVDADGRFKDFVTPFAGQLVKPKDDEAAEVSHLDADIEVVKALKEADRLVRKENIVHSYPHCWRCDTPLLNYGTTSWFVRVTDIKDKLVEENKKIHWVPEHVGTSRFGKWLEGARDWAVSRQRYWGAPLPIWRNPETKEYKVFGSLAELQEYTPKSGNSYLLMRHGESESNVAGIVSAQKENKDGLTETGREQVKATVPSLAGVDLIIHSGYERTKQTADLLAAELGLDASAVIEDERIGELAAGAALEGKTWAEYLDLFGDFTAEFTKQIAGVENRLDVQKRAGAFLYELEEKYKNKKILVVGHGSSLYALQSVAKGADIEAAVAMRHDCLSDFPNAQIRPLDFAPMPHNDNYELDFHRPYIDRFVVVDADGTQMERVPDVFDCWFESGSMPYGQQHYPFENTDVFEPKEDRGYPANFISESIDQTRGWFYSMIVLGVALFDKSPYQAVVTNGLVLAEDGKKMSKSLQNYPDPMELVSRLGADTMRFYLLSSPIIKAEDLNFSEQGVLELQRKNIGRLHNVLAMYETYAGAAGEEIAARADSTHVLDRWIIARQNQLITEVTEGFENYELDRATRPITDFIDDLSVWYLRRSRERLKGGDAADAAATLGTLRSVLKTLAVTMAPSMPFYAEYLYSKVKEAHDPESVHLAVWPGKPEVDTAVVEEMRVTRDVVSLALEARAKANIKIRQPLQTLLVKHEVREEAEPYLALIRDEVNVKEIVSDMSLENEVQLDLTISPELQMEGDARELMRGIQDMRKKAGLLPHDRIVVAFGASDTCKAMIEKFENEITDTVGAEKISFEETNGTEIKIGDETITVSIEKV